MLHHLHSLIVLFFLFSVGILGYTFFGYGLLISILARLRPRPLPAQPDFHPAIAVVLVASNEESRIAERIRNLLAAEYPPEKIRVVLVSDGSTDRTAAEAAALNDPRVLILVQPERLGKAAGLNRALADLPEEIVVFADARQSFAPEAIARLVRHFSDPQIGAVSGSLEIARSSSVTGAGGDFYWRYEKVLRAAESRYDSCIGCTGAIYAIRRGLYVPLPGDTLLDDVVTPLQIARLGKRVVHDPTAVAFDPQPLDPAAEQRRKPRTIAGNFQMLFRYPQWLEPSGHRLWWQLISHKYLRLMAPLFLVVAFGTNLLLIRHHRFALLFLFQLGFYFSAAMGMAGYKSRFFTLPAGFVFLNAMTFRGLAHYLALKEQRGWK